MKRREQGVWFGCRHAIPAIRKSGGGSVINTASFVALLGAATPQVRAQCVHVCVPVIVCVGGHSVAAI